MKRIDIEIEKEVIVERDPYHDQRLMAIRQAAQEAEAERKQVARIFGCVLFAIVALVVVVLVITLQ